jgi:hypothetical protein
MELTPHAERRLRLNAWAQRKSVQEYLQSLISALPAPPEPSEYEATIALFQEWAEEDAKMTPEEIAEEDAAWEEIEASIRANRCA